MKKIIIASSAIITVIAVALASGEGASQKWVNMRISQQETNTQITVDLKIESNGTNTMNVVDAKLEALRQELLQAMAKANEILAETNNPASITNAMRAISEGTYPTSMYYLDAYGFGL